VAEGLYGHTPLEQAVRADAHKVQGGAPEVRIVLGNWRNDSLLLLDRRQEANKSQYDVVLIDFLLAAVHMHWPFAEDEVLCRVLQAVKPRGGLALLTGIEPYDLVLDPGHESDALVLNAEALGDAAALLAHRSSYRELPMEWVLRQVSRVGDFRVVSTRFFPMTINSESLRSQLSFARSEAKHVKDDALRSVLLARAQRLLVDVNGMRLHRRGKSYAIVLERK
jgi:hypothetical protein